ncbi:copper resistance D family protein [Roseobacter sinensis]|uniref:CopD family protein n=1 Tax=Roseobacter sinensis TaxID=2931391 RepID=A0ABT3BIS5_9RHOB|nr:CopD family protein [Roseobacter sp. WL0113]MCV3273469.1 CopD family protein [Roseobacter sp. WL0113]
MISALASADAQIWLAILVKTVAYLATLVAAGSVVIYLTLGALTEQGRSSLRRIAAVAALAAAGLSLLRIPLRASFLMGGTVEGAVDPMMLRIVAESPLGASVIVRLGGLALILAVFLPGRGARWVALAGALVTCASFALRGHTLGEPRLLLGALVTVHAIGLAFWIGAFAPLTRAVRCDPPAVAGALVHEFGAKALWVVATLVAAGALTLVLLGAATPAALATPYGQAFLIKLGLFAGVLALAGLNKTRLTPALQAAAPDAARRLRRSIGMESVLVLAVLATTAALTTLTSPPSEQARSASQTTPTHDSAIHVSGDLSWPS